MALRTFDVFDRIVFNTVLAEPTENELNRIRESALDARKEESHRDFIFTLMDALDSKTSALLTHISLIVAALTFIYTAHEHGAVARWFLLLEIIFYLVLTIFCLRAIRMTSGLSSIDKDETQALEVELSRRRAVYNFAASTTIVVTTVMILTLLLVAILGDQPITSSAK